jgi:hypothetical protein
MSSIPLPALDIKPPQPQPDPLEQYQRLAQIKNMQAQQQQNAQLNPLRVQQAQNEVQTSGAQAQQAMQAQQDQKAMTAAMTQWDGKDYNDLMPLVLKNGGSAQAVIGLKQKALEQQTQLSTIAKNNGDAAASMYNAQKTKGDLLDGALSPLVDPKQVPDAELPQAIVSTAQSLVQKGILDPQHAQAAAQIAQSGDPDQMRQQIDLLRKGNLAQSQVLEEGAKMAGIASETATAQSKTAETNYYAQHGGAPGVPAEIQQQNDWLAKNPGKGPSDYKLWTLQHTPSAMVMGNQLGGDQNSQGLDLAAQNYRLTGQMPPGLSRSPGSTIAIMNRAAQMDQQDGGAGIAGNKAVLQSNMKSLDGLQKNYDQVQAFEQTASKNMDLLQQTAQKIPDLGARFANIPVRMVSSQMIGTENMAAFKTALATAQTEAAKVLNSSNATGVLSDSSRHELQDIIDGNMPLPAMVASLNTLKQDMGNRTASYQAQISDIQRRIKGAGTSAPESQPPAKSGTDPFAQFGGVSH